MTLPVARIRAALEREGLLVEARGLLPDAVPDVADDSRRVTRGGLFIAVRGAAADGHEFLGAAQEAGAALALVEDAGRSTLPALVVRDGRRAAAIAAAAAFDEPARRLTMLGVTGTNGKTTTVGILRHLLDEADARSASIGTLGVLMGSEGIVLPGGGGLTTPGPVELQRVLRALVDAGVRSVAMEVSSHSLDQRRVAGLRFVAGVFTNLTRDHLDYHGTMAAYLAAKAQLIDYLTLDGAAVVNRDDPAWTALPSAPRTIGFGRAHGADVRAESIVYETRGSRWQLVSEAGAASVSLPLVGEFNVENALAAAATAISLGHDLATIAERLTTLPQVPGRLERLAESPAIYRDYAHTPDALERALDAVRAFTPGRIIVVFGCGGDRDRGKRPEMGRIAARLADLSIVTSDNPRTEDPDRILDDIEAGMDGAPRRRIEDRREAIGVAIAEADPARDLVLLAGKGHETYQIRGTTSYPFDERMIVHELLYGQPIS